MSVRKNKHILSILFLALFFSSISIFAQSDDTVNLRAHETDERVLLDEDSFLIVDDEFSEFNEFKEIEKKQDPDCASCPYGGAKNRKSALYWVLGSLFFTILAGIFVRFRETRYLRGIFLITAIIVLGFYHGACPCPIMSFQNLILMGVGADVHWQKIIWFVALIPITYLLGKVWCGWICHLGALQEFIFLPGRLNILKSEKSQKIMRMIRIVLLVVLIAQLIITRTNYLVKIDPFKVAFNLFSTNITGYILLILLLISSIFIFRPFCKMICPIGLVLGWISKIPGASVIGVNNEYNACDLCSSACKINAITRDNKSSAIDNQECIACGECIDSCPQKGLSFFRKGKKGKDKSLLCLP